MLTTAFLLFTLSTLASQISAVPTNDRIYDPCEGKTHCFEKPADYPQEKMDFLVSQSDLQHLHRSKREAEDAFKNIEKNECFRDSHEMAPVYTAKDINNKTRSVVQSHLLSQTIPKITCNTKKTCFAKLRIGKFQCRPSITRVNLIMVNDANTNVTLYETDITTGCFCAKQTEEN